LTAPNPPFPLTRETTIRLDREGVFWHDNQRVTHDGLARAFASWIDLDDESGRYILKNSINWCFLTVEDAPIFVRGYHSDDGTLDLSDGKREPLDPATLRLDEDDVPYCDVRGGRMPARFTRDAAFALLDQLITAGRVGEVRRVARGAGATRTPAPR
jgi:hypothetical protein